ncbi:MAG TPA: hypothetical protein V6C69_00925 [Trichormus sp.]|jgi:hypothetical protein
MRHTQRAARGVTLLMVAMCALLLIIAIVALFKLLTYFGGSQELKNSVDAAALAVSQRAVEIEIALPNHPDKQGLEYIYSDVVDSRQKFGLANINRVWGKAYLINANAQQMQAQGFDQGAAVQNGQIAYDQAKDIDAQLYQLVTNKGSVDDYFKRMTAGKPARLLGTAGEVTTTNKNDWATACVYRGDESNLQLSAQTVPQPVAPSTITNNGTTYLQGYNAMSANNQYFCFTTFHANEGPHLISDSTFTQAQHSALNNATNPIPNAFRESGQLNSNLPMAAAASAVVNPMRTFQLAIPHSYVTITLGPGLATWTVEGKIVMQNPYGLGTGEIQGVKDIKLKSSHYDVNKHHSEPNEGTLKGYAVLGNDFGDGSLWSAINALPGDHSAVINPLLQRINEFKPGFTLAQLQALLTKTPIPTAPAKGAPPIQTWYIFPEYQTPDLSDPQVQISTGAPVWATLQPAEGEDKLLCQDQAHNAPNRAWSYIIGPYSTDINFIDSTGQLFWQPGTGFQQCLGSLRIVRATAITFTGAPPGSNPAYSAVGGGFGQ